MFFSLISAAAQAAELLSGPPTIESVAQSHYWKLLLHYHRGWLSPAKSEAEGAGFFISPRGRVDLEAELRADLAAFQSSEAHPIGPLRQHPQCAFPERYRFLKSTLALTIADKPCPEFQAWKSHLPQSVTLVYAAAYLSSPASMFGHSFLRLDSPPRAGQKKKNDLLDYGVSFDAITGPNPGIGYAIKGLLGLYPGVFSLMPYYLKTNAYVNMESRDLWEYQLNLTPEQIDHLLNHLWELGTTDFPYYFFNRNCSYELLALLELANPKWNLQSHFGAMAIPIDTVRAVLQQPGAVRSVKRRASLLHTIERRLAHMTPAERARFYVGQKQISDVQASDSVKVLDALMDWQKYSAMTNSLTADEAEKKIDQRLLVMRAQVDETDEAVTDESEPPSPDTGHPSSKLSVLGGTEQGLSYFGVEFRPAFHDLLDPDSGYIPGSSLIVGRTRVSMQLSGINKIRLDDLTFGEVTSAPPYRRLDKSLSWTIGGGLTRPLDTGCADCIAGDFHGGIGLTFGAELREFRASFTAMATALAQYSHGFSALYDQDYRSGPGLRLSTQLSATDHLHLQLSAERFQLWPDFNTNYLWRYGAAVAYSFVPFDLRIEEHSDLNPLLTVHTWAMNLGYYF